MAELIGMRLAGEANAVGERGAAAAVVVDRVAGRA